MDDLIDEQGEGGEDELSQMPSHPDLEAQESALDIAKQYSQTLVKETSQEAKNQ